MIAGDPRYDPAARRKKIADLKVKTTNKQTSKQASKTEANIVNLNLALQSNQKDPMGDS